jgi:Flp pilus assembly protein TadD
VRRALTAWAISGLMVAVAHAQSAPPPDAIARNSRGVALVKEGKAGEAVEEFRAAVQIFPKYATAQGNLAHAYQQTGRLDDAMAAYQKLLDLEPTNATARNNLATLYSRSGRHEDAIREFEALIEREPGNESARRNLENAKRNMGILAERDQQSGRALKAAEARPNDPRAAYDVARVYAQQGENDKALTWLVKALDLGYDQTDYVKVDPTFAGLRKDPRFIKILEERLGTPPRASR